MLWVERVGDRRSQAILARDCSVKNGAQAQNEKKTPPRRRSCEVFLFLLFLPSRAVFAAARSGQGRAAFQARREPTLDGEDRCERIGEGGKDLALKSGISTSWRTTMTAKDHKPDLSSKIPKP